MKNQNLINITLLVIIVFLISCSSESKSLSISPHKLDFSNVNLGDYVELTLEIKNNYGKDVIITNLDIIGSGDYTITANGSVPINLQKGQTHSLTVKFEPTSSGIISAVLSILHDASSKSKDIDITGIGVPVPRIVIPTMSHDFGVIVINTTAVKIFNIQNTGTADLILNALTFSGSGASTYSISSGGSIPVTITPGVTHQIEVEFAPTADGSYPAILSVVHNAINEYSPINITLEGEGITHAPEITLNQTSPWDVGDATISNGKIVELEISSTGIHDLLITSITFATGTEFSLDSIEDSNGAPVSLPQTVVVSDKIIVKIKFHPPLISTYNDTLSIVHDAINEASPLDIAVSGTGKNPTIKTFNYTGGIVNWTVPAGVTTLVIEVWGAEGGWHSSSVYQPGKGARMKGTFNVTPGDTLKILVGQHPIDGNGGGGGSFVCKSNNDPVIIAGAGGGSARTTDSNTKDGQITQNGGAGAGGGGAGGTNGNGGLAGSTAWNAGAGGGLLTAGANGSSYGGQSFISGGAGGSGNAKGGFGGGGSGSAYVVGGGGGGYSGGGGGGNSTAGVGGGGGSYNNGSSPDNTAGTRSDHGQVQITY